MKRRLTCAVLALCLLLFASALQAAPDFPPPDTRPMAEIMAEYADQHVMRDDEKLGDLLDALRTQNAKTLQAFAELDLDTLVPIPHEVPWFPSDIDHWTVRWVTSWKCRRCIPCWWG